MKIVSLTCDGAASNIAMANCLGTNLTYSTLKTYFLHPNTQEEVFIMLDACHMIKLVRNALGHWGLIRDKQGNAIKWEYFKCLVDLQEQEGLHAVTKLRVRHINFSTEKMKVNTFTDKTSHSRHTCYDKTAMYRHTYFRVCRTRRLEPSSLPYSYIY